MNPRLAALLFVLASGVSAMAAPPLVRNPYPIRVDGNPGLLLRGDFGGDPADDLVVVQRSALHAAISVAGGPFAPVVTTTVSNEAIYAAAPGHFDADGFLDLAVAVWPAQVGIYHGNGDGTFRRGEIAGSPVYGRSIAVADFNDDGDADVVVANESSSGVSVHLGDGAGHLGAGIVTALSDSPTHLLTADFNGDGNADLVLSNYSSTTVAIGLGDGRFSATFTHRRHRRRRRARRHPGREHAPGRRGGTFPLLRLGARRGRPECPRRFRQRRRPRRRVQLVEPEASRHSPQRRERHVRPRHDHQLTGRGAGRHRRLHPARRGGARAAGSVL